MPFSLQKKEKKSFFIVRKWSSIPIRYLCGFITVRRVENSNDMSSRFPGVDLLSQWVHVPLDRLSAACKDVEPWKVVGVTAVTTYSLVRLRYFLEDEEFSEFSRFIFQRFDFLTFICYLLLKNMFPLYRCDGKIEKVCFFLDPLHSRS